MILPLLYTYLCNWSGEWVNVPLLLFYSFAFPHSSSLLYNQIFFDLASGDVAVCYILHIVYLPFSHLAHISIKKLMF